MKKHDTPPTNLTSLSARLRNVCTAEGLLIGRVNRAIAVVVAGQLVSRVEGVAAIKGGSNLEARLGSEATRVSKDLDTAIRGTHEDFADELREHLRDGWEGFSGTLEFKKAIRAPVPEEYAPAEYTLKLQYKGKPFTSLKFEVSSEEIGGLAELDHVVPEAARWMVAVGLPTPPAIPTLRLDHQIAQKLHACTAPDTDVFHNERAHDLVDLQLAEGLNEHPRSQLRETAVRLFASRKRHAWPPEVTPRRGWSERYLEEAAGLSVLPTLEEAIAWCNEFVAQIDAASDDRG